jgi:proline dehydrogenase
MVEELHAKNLSGNISIKLTQLGLDIDKELCRSMAREIAVRAATLGRSIEMDMEGSVYTDVTLDIFESVQRELATAGWPCRPLPLPHGKGSPKANAGQTKIRLVKGAYREQKPSEKERSR